MHLAFRVLLLLGGITWCYRSRQCYFAANLELMG